MSDDDMKSLAKEIIDADDSFGVTSLKMEAEVCLVNATTLSVEKVKDLLIYADSKNCALLKEAVMDYMFEQMWFLQIFDLMMPLVCWLVMYLQPLHGPRYERTVEELLMLTKTVQAISIPCVSELRQKVHEKGLDVDKSRDTN